MTKKEYLEAWFQFTLEFIEAGYFKDFEELTGLKLVYNKKLEKFYFRKKS